MLNLTSLVRSLMSRATQFVDRLLGFQPQQADSVPPVSDSVAHAAEPETIAAPVVPEGREPEPVVVPATADSTTNKVNEGSPVELSVPLVEPIAVRERPTRQCRNSMHPKTHKQCTNRVWLDNESQLCADCVHDCWGGCGYEIFWWHTHCDTCRKQGRIKRCQDCGVLVRLGHKLCAACRPQVTQPTKVRPLNQTRKPGEGWLQPESHMPTERHKCGRRECNRMIPAHHPYCLTHRRS